LGIAQRTIAVKYAAKSRKKPWVKPLPVKVKSIGDWIQVRLQKANLAPYHLGEAIGISARLVRAWADGTDRPTEQQLQVLTRFFGCDANRDPRRAGSIPSSA
jgi:hypothetical protein